MEIGYSTFVETTPDDHGQRRGHGLRLRQAVEEIVLADSVGLDVVGVGEHHRPDYACSAPAVVLAAAASRTSKIRLSSAVTVLSSDDPVRVFQDFATLDGLSEGRAEIMVGRGSFIESFPLFGQDLDDYEELFAQKLELLLALRSSEKVSWSGGHRPAIANRGVYPRPVQDPLPVWIGSGGNQESVARAGLLGLPLALAIIGGDPSGFAPLVALYRKAGAQAGHPADTLKVAVHSHGYVASTTEGAADEFFPSTARALNIIGSERGWGRYDRAAFDAARSPRGALYVGDPTTVAEKIVRLDRSLGGIDRFLLHLPVGTMDPQQVLEALSLLGREVAPGVREQVSLES